MTSTATSQTAQAYLLFWSGQIVSLLGSTIVQFVIIWWIVVTYLDPMFLAIAYLLGIGVQILFMPIAGVFVDRWNRKLILAISDALQAVGAVGLIILFSLSNRIAEMDLYWGVVYLITLRGITGSFHAPAAQAIVPLMVPQKYLNRLNGLQFTFLGFINILGPAIGAVFYEAFPINTIIWIDVFTFVMAMVPLLVITIPETPPNGVRTSSPELDVSQESFVQEFREGLHILRSKEGLLPLLLVVTLINLLQIPIAVLGPIFIYYTHSGSVADLAFIIGLSQFGMLVSGVFLTIKKDWHRKSAAIMVAFYIQLFGYFIQVITPLGVFWFMGMGAFIFGAMMPLTDALFRTILQVIVPPELQGRVSAIAASVAGATLPLGMVASGPLAAELGIVQFLLLTIVASVFILTASWFLTSIRKLDQLLRWGLTDPHNEPVAVPQEQITRVGN